MTFKKKLQKEHPEKVDKKYCGGCRGCPHTYGYGDGLCNGCHLTRAKCEDCWSRDIPVLTKNAKAKIGENVHIWEQKLIDQAISATKPIMSRKDIDALIRIGNVHESVSALAMEHRPLDGLSAMLFSIDEMHGWPIRSAPKINMPGIKQVIFNDPATIVIWADGEKTVVKCQNGEPYDPEKGLAMAISKRALGNKHEYYNTFKHWLKKYNSNGKVLTIDMGITAEEAVEGIKKMNESFKKHMRGCVDT